VNGYVRKADGTFAAGNRGGPGHPGYGKEYKFRKIFDDVFDEATVRAACIQLKSHIFGQKIDMASGKIVDDPDATANSILTAWQKMADYKFGKAVQPIIDFDNHDEELTEALREVAESLQLATNDKLETFVTDMKKHLKKLNDAAMKKKRKKKIVAEIVEQSVDGDNQ
jgi:Rad3-related DNA helicase